MAKANEQYEEILDELSILKSKNIASEQRLANIENLLAKLATKEDVAQVAHVSTITNAHIPHDEVTTQVGSSLNI